MGRLAGLISSSIGLAMEAKTCYQPPSNKSDGNNGNSVPSYTDRFQTPRHTSPKVNQPGNDEEAYRDLQVYADYQSNLSDRISADLQREENYRRYLAETPQTRPTRGTYERDVAFYAHELPDQRVQPTRGLSCPVIIPQRRPENQSRGIIRAYAPELAGCGIDQETFLEFIDEFNEAHKASPYLDAVNIAAQGVGFVPGISPMVVSMVVPIAVRAAKGHQTQRQSSSFLDRANKKLFIPHGLFAMVLTFKPDQNKDPYEAQGQVQLPASASLLYPEDHQRAERTGLKKAGHFIADYADRRAQARYAYKNPDSSLASPLPAFESRWGDPNYPANSTGLKSLLTGIPDDRNASKQDKKDRKRDKKSRGRRGSPSSNSSRRGGTLTTALEAVGEASGRRGIPGRGRPSLGGTARGMIKGPPKQDQSLIKGIKSIGMKTDILYLMITNNTEGPASFPSTRSQTSLSYTPPPMSPLQNQHVNPESDNWQKSSELAEQLVYPISYQDRTVSYTGNQQRNNLYLDRQNQVASRYSSGYYDQNDAPPPAYREAIPARYYDRIRDHDEEFCVPTL